MVLFDFEYVMARKNVFIEDLAKSRREELTGGNFKFLRAHARFVDPHTIEMDDGGRLTSAHFVITTGSSVAPPPLPEFEQVGYLTSDDALKLNRLPESLVILGGGAVAVEFAQFFARFEVRVTLLQRSGHLLSDFDTDIAEDVESVFFAKVSRFSPIQISQACSAGRLAKLSRLFTRGWRDPSLRKRSC